MGLDDIQTTIVTAGSLIFALCLQPLYGALSDRIGRKPLLIWFGVMGTIATIPLLDALQATKSVLVAFLLIAAAWVIVAGYTSINAVVKAELFPTSVRATGALWFQSIGHQRWLSYYLTAVIAASLVVYAFSAFLLASLIAPSRGFAATQHKRASIQESACRVDGGVP